MRLVIVNTFDRYSGAERCAWGVFQGARQAGHDAWMVTGWKRTADEHVVPLPNEARRSAWARPLRAWADRLRRTRGAWRLAAPLEVLAEPIRHWRISRGCEDFNFPGTDALLGLVPPPVDILHLHNMQGGYFDLAQLPRLSRSLPTFLTLHDQWSFTGHCAYSFACERWEMGCGDCPDLARPPSVARDATAANLARKAEIYRHARLRITAPSQWLLDLARRSVLAPAICEARVIPYGIDLAVFRPGDREAARRQLGLPPDAFLLVFSGNHVTTNPYKDPATMLRALARLAPRNRPVILLVLGDRHASGQAGAVEIRGIPFQEDPRIVALHYQAADLSLHAALADNSPFAVIEALACGLPVVATAVGGIVEQVQGMDLPGFTTTPSREGAATGVLVPAGDDGAMAAAITLLLDDSVLRRHLGANAARTAARRFAFARQTQDYLAWYAEALAER